MSTGFITFTIVATLGELAGVLILGSTVAVALCVAVKWAMKDKQ